MNTVLVEIEIPEALKTGDGKLPDKLTFLPENLEELAVNDQPVYTESMIELRKLFRANLVEFSILGAKASRFRDRKSADLYLPAIFIGVSLLSENQPLISVALSIIANYVTDYFKGRVGPRKVSLDIYVEKTDKKKIMRISYEGDVEGIEKLEPVIKNLK